MTKQASGLIGLQHQNDDLFRNSFLGKISPITGGFLTEKSAFYLYTGAQAEYDLGFLTITPSFCSWDITIMVMEKIWVLL